VAVRPRDEGLQGIYDMSISLKPIIPKKPSKAAMWRELVGGMNDTMKETDRRFIVTYLTWDDQPKFDTKVIGKTPGSKQIRGIHATEHQKYEWVVRGTPPHIIAARNAGMLAFSSDFVPKTRPGVIGSGTGFVGPVDTFAKSVMHPGTMPRNFDKEIAKDMKPVFLEIMTAAMARARQASGQAI
jgi:hypothetical protein